MLKLWPCWPKHTLLPLPVPHHDISFSVKNKFNDFSEIVVHLYILTGQSMDYPVQAYSVGDRVLLKGDWSAGGAPSGRTVESVNPVCSKDISGCEQITGACYLLRIQWFSNLFPGFRYTITCDSTRSVSPFVPEGCLSPNPLPLPHTFRGKQGPSLSQLFKPSGSVTWPPPVKFCVPPPPPKEQFLIESDEFDSLLTNAEKVTFFF